MSVLAVHQWNFQLLFFYFHFIYDHFLSVIGFIMNESLAKVQRRRPKITSKTSSLLEISRFDIIFPN